MVVDGVRVAGPFCWVASDKCVSIHPGEEEILQKEQEADPTQRQPVGPQ